MCGSMMQRLRQGQQRCQQQLLSLVNWQQEIQQRASDAAFHHQRGWASDAPAAVKFAKDRKAFESSLSELRKQWAQRRQEKAAAEAAAEEAARAAQEAARVQRQQQDLAARQARRAQYAAQQEAARELRLAAKAARLQREQLRAEVLDVARDERRAALLRQSVHWVTPQSLDARIQEALDHPVPLYVE